jgi:hypothetical protein
MWQSPNTYLPWSFNKHKDLQICRYQVSCNKFYISTWWSWYQTIYGSYWSTTVACHSGVIWFITPCYIHVKVLTLTYTQKCALWEVGESSRIYIPNQTIWNLYWYKEPDYSDLPKLEYSWSTSVYESVVQTIL